MYLIHSTKNLNFKNLIYYPEIKIKKNTFSFIIGESGCGKSTYLKLLNGTNVSSGGNILFNGKNIKNIEILNHRKKVLLLPQEIFLFNGSIKENFDYYYSFIEKKNLSENEIKKFLEICCIELPISTNCSNLSGGEKQRVFISIFISFKPNILLLDEPNSSLDENISIKLFKNLKQFFKENNITSICICHNNKLVDMFSDNTIRLEKKYEQYN